MKYKPKYAQWVGKDAIMEVVKTPLFHLLGEININIIQYGKINQLLKNI